MGAAGVVVSLTKCERERTRRGSMPRGRRKPAKGKSKGRIKNVYIRSVSAAIARLADVQRDAAAVVRAIEGGAKVIAGPPRGRGTPRQRAKAALKNLQEAIVCASDACGDNQLGAPYTLEVSAAVARKLPSKRRG
jgi:hypothetical protein